MMEMEVVTPHCDGLSGVNVYVDVPGVAVLMTAGFHVPVIPSMEAAGRAGGTEFWQRGPMTAKVGVTSAVMVMDMEAVTPHCDGLLGVNVYVDVPGVVVLMTAGFHVPVIPSMEAAGRAGGVEFWQRGPMAANVGVTSAVMVMDMEVVMPH